jgi:hypothetical protein
MIGGENFESWNKGALDSNSAQPRDCGLFKESPASNVPHSHNNVRASSKKLTFKTINLWEKLRIEVLAGADRGERSVASFIFLQQEFIEVVRERTAVEDIRAEDFAPGQAYVPEHLVEDLAGGPVERDAVDLLLLSRSLADDGDAGRDRAGRGNDRTEEH